MGKKVWPQKCLFWHLHFKVCIFFAVPAWAKGLTWYFDISLWLGPRFEPETFFKREKLLEGEELCVRPTRGIAYCYRAMVNSPGVLYGQNMSLMLQARQHNSQSWYLVPHLSVLCLYLYALVISYLVHDMMISSRVIGMHTSSFGLNNERGKPKSRDEIATVWGCNPIT